MRTPMGRLWGLVVLLVLAGGGVPSPVVAQTFAVRGTLVTCDPLDPCIPERVGNSFRGTDGVVYEYSGVAWVPRTAPAGDVRRFGAKCDGSTDDTQEFQDAADAGGDIHVPFFGTGVCMLDQVTITTETHWACEAGASLKLRSATSGVNTAILLFSAGTASDSSVEGCEFHGNKSTLSASYGANTNAVWSGVQVTGGAS